MLRLWMPPSIVNMSASLSGLSPRIRPPAQEDATGHAVAHHRQARQLHVTAARNHATGISHAQSPEEDVNCQSITVAPCGSLRQLHQHPRKWSHLAHPGGNVTPGGSLGRARRHHVQRVNGHPQREGQERRNTDERGCSGHSTCRGSEEAGRVQADDSQNWGTVYSVFCVPRIHASRPPPVPAPGMRDESTARRRGGASLKTTTRGTGDRSTSAVAVSPRNGPASPLFSAAVMSGSRALRRQKARMRLPGQTH